MQEFLDYRHEDVCIQPYLHEQLAVCRIFPAHLFSGVKICRNLEAKDTLSQTLDNSLVLGTEVSPLTDIQIAPNS